MKALMPRVPISGGGDGKDHIGVRLGGVGDEDFAAVEDVVVALEDGGGLSPPASDPALGSVRPKAPIFSPLGQGHQVLALLLLGAVRRKWARSLRRRGQRE